jgi:hypothetical protein
MANSRHAVNDTDVNWRYRYSVAWEATRDYQLRTTQIANHRDEALTMPAEIYGWFTEGLNTADLKDVQGLLDQLKAPDIPKCFARGAIGSTFPDARSSFASGRRNSDEHHARNSKSGYARESP